MTPINRRDFLQLSTMAATAAVSGAAHAATAGHTYEITTAILIKQNSGATKVWLPVPLAETPFQRLLVTTVRCETGEVSRLNPTSRDTANPPMISAQFRSGVEQAITVTHRVSTRNWTVPVQRSRRTVPEARDAKAYLAPTRYVPTDGIVKARADAITKGLTTDLDKTRAVYEWIVENTHRDPKVRGCGEGDIKPMLETGDLGGKCADLNGLFVGLVKAAGVPARDVYGIRAGATELSCKSLGTSSDKITKSQHCRAEVFLEGIGWAPMDPADVRKVMLEEPGLLSHDDLNDPKVTETRKRLFGSWEGNWIAYSYAQDVTLPGSSGPSLHFFMYPQAETADGRLDSLSPDEFQYEITTREITG